MNPAMMRASPTPMDHEPALPVRKDARSDSAPAVMSMYGATYPMVNPRTQQATARNTSVRCVDISIGDFVMDAGRRAMPEDMRASRPPPGGPGGPPMLMARGSPVGGGSAGPSSDPLVARWVVKGARGSRTVCWPMEDAVVIRPPLTRNGSEGFRWGRGDVRTWSKGGNETFCRNSCGGGIAPGVVATARLASASGSTSGVAKPSGRSSGAYAAPSVQEAMHRY